MSLSDLADTIRGCKKCGLWMGALNAVPGDGPEDARVMLIGQNPGAEEDKTGRPFVGRSGRYLNEVLRKNGIDRQSLFITSVVKHVSPNNRLPKQDEVCACMPYLTCQMSLIKPRLVVLMGALAWQVPQFNDIEYIKTYHPSAALRGFTKIRKKFEEDFVALKKRF